MAIKVRPLHDRLIVQRLEEEEQQVGGIIIPDTAKEKPQQGKVVAVGKGKVKEDGGLQPMDVAEGDTILFGKYSGQEIKLVRTEEIILFEDHRVVYYPHDTCVDQLVPKSFIRRSYNGRDIRLASDGPFQHHEALRRVQATSVDARASAGKDIFFRG